MRFSPILALSITSLLSLSACFFSTGSSGPITVRFLHYNDLHAHLIPHLDVVREGTTKTLVERGGLARLATLVKQQRADNPKSILMNIGDTFHGGVEARFTSGNAVVGPVNALGVDIGVPGNWDFAYDTAVFRARYTNRLRPAYIEKVNFPNLAANLTQTISGDPILPPTYTINVGGVKVGFIGFTSDIVPVMHEGLSIGMTFVSGETNYKDLVNLHASQLRAEGAKIVVLMSELGIQKDYRLAQIIDSGALDVIFSAHTHEATFTPLNSASGALVVEAGNDGYLGRMDITLSEQGDVVNRQWTLLTIGNDIAEDPQMKALVDAKRAPFLSATINMQDPMPISNQVLNQPINTVIGHTDHLLDRRHALESSFNNAATDLLRSFAGTTAAITPGFRFDSVVAPSGWLLEDNTVTTGAITIEDIYRFFPVGFTMASGQITTLQLKQTMEDILTSVYSADAFAQQGGWFNGFAGLQIKLNLANPDGSRILEIRAKASGKVLADTDVISMAGCVRPFESSDKLCSLPGFSNVAAIVNPLTNAAFTVNDLYIKALQDKHLFDPSRRDITDLNATPSWPTTDFIQPLTGAQ